MSLLQSLERLQKDVDKIVLDALNGAFPLLNLAIADNMHDGARPKSGNKTDKLYVNTGRLLRSFTVGASESIQRLKISGDNVELTYGTSVFYAKFNEDGTSRMKARPFLAPAISEFFTSDLNQIEEDIQEGLRRVFK